MIAEACFDGETPSAAGREVRHRAALLQSKCKRVLSKVARMELSLFWEKKNGRHAPFMTDGRLCHLKKGEDRDIDMHSSHHFESDGVDVQTLIFCTVAD